MASPTADMGLAFRTRQKLAGTGATEDKDLRRVVLLCNTYDTFQRRMQEHVCASRALFAGLDRGEKAQVTCRELAIVDDDDYDDDADDDHDFGYDSEDEDEDKEEAKSVEQRRLSTLADDEQPPPYELHMPDDPDPTTTAQIITRDFAVGLQVATAEVTDEEDQEGEEEEEAANTTTEAPVTEHDDNNNAANAPPSYSASTGAVLAGKVPSLQAAPADPKALSLTAPPLPPRNSRRMQRPSLPNRVSYGHHTVGLSAEHARGVMEVH